MTEQAWVVRLSAAAQSDFHEIVRWTTEHFGSRQGSVYAETLSDAVVALMAGPAARGVKARNDIAPGLYTLHVARKRRRGRHFILFRIGSHAGQPIIDVVRVLHDSMDLARHVSVEKPDRREK